MSRKFSLAALVAAGLLVLGCTGADRTPTGALGGHGPRMVLNAPSLQVLQDQIDALFPSGGLRTAAQAHLRNITNDLDNGKTDNARKKAFELINFMRQKQKGGQLLDPNGAGVAPTTGEAADALASALYLYVGLTPAGTPPSAIAVDGAIAVVGPEGGTVVTGGPAPNGAVVFPAGALTQYVTVTIERLPDPNGTNYAEIPYRKYAIAFDIKTVPTVTLPNTAKATVAVCTVEPPNAGAAPDPSRLILGHITGTASYELLPPGTSEGPLPSLCDDARLAALDAPPSGTLRFALWQAGRLGDRALDALAPRAAYAGHGGLLGQTTTFSPFVPVDTFAVASVGVTPAAATVAPGGTVALTETPRNVNGTDVSSRVGAATWSSSNTAVATVSSTGVVTGVSTGTATITATVEGVAGSSAITVGLSDPGTSGGTEESSTDAGCPETSPSCPDFSTTSASVDATSLHLSFRFRPQSYDPTASLIYTTLDMDQNPNTGFPGLTSGTPTDADLIGGDYFVYYGPSTLAEGNVAGVSRATCPVPRRLPTGTDPQAGCTFTFVGNAVATPVQDGVDIVVPRALLNDTDGTLNYKATSQIRLSANGFTGILDVISNVGSPAISVSQPIFIP